jgi:anti-sigma regulatory factor (Ser/Thr protein kinase)
LKVGTRAERDAASLTASELCLPAWPSELDVARAYAGEAAAAFGLDAERSYEFVCAVNEAVTNAIRHGALDAQGLIRLSIVADDDRLTFAVRDYGTFMVPILDPATRSEHGRGLAPMVSFVNEVQLCARPGSTTVSLSKARA